MIRHQIGARYEMLLIPYDKINFVNLLTIRFLSE